MGFSIADQYYLKALDSYPFDLNESVENLNYALSYSKEHAQANCLMARVYSEQLNKPDLAVQYFEQALFYDLSNIEAISYYVFFLIKTEDFEKAKKLIDYGYTIKGIGKAMLLRYEALVTEYQKMYNVSKKLLKEAINESFSKSEIDFLKEELARVKGKIRGTKGSKQKKKKKK